MTHASVFSGIGGPEVAASMLGWENLFHCEINDFGRAVLDYWFPNSESYGDITKTDFSKWGGGVDVLTGGFPCQPFSYAGKRNGAEDDRYLWPEMLRVIEQVRPTWFVGENVNGIRTMVEQGDRLPLGCESSLFGEGDNTLYEEHSIFTIERICRNLESVGYSVQPIVIPACAVSAPHRRDRVFFIAHSNRSNDLREAGGHEGESREERIQERNAVREFGESGDVRRSAEDTMLGGFVFGQHEEQGCERNGLAERIPCEQESLQFGGGCRKDLAGINATDSDNEGLERRDQPRSEEGGEWEHLRRAFAGHDCKDNEFLRGLLPEERWAEFPLVSPVHRGNDGLPFDVDDLTISFAKWRTESLKAYGNAIVPQVMYEIFRSIELAERM